MAWKHCLETDAEPHPGVLNSADVTWCNQSMVQVHPSHIAADARTPTSRKKTRKVVEHALDAGDAGDAGDPEDL